MEELVRMTKLLCGALALSVPLLAGAAAGAPARLGDLAVPGFEARSIPGDQFEKLHRAVAPGKERWAEIPWETDLAAARARAQREGRPMLMWIMDGHPLGCT